MDFILSVCVALMIVGLLAAYAFNRVPRTARLASLLKDLLLRQPTTVAFSLGYDRERGLYKNATVDREGGVSVRYDANPVARDGSFIFLREHGEIREDGDGYRMSGMDTVHMLCPQGFGGLDCELKPLCAPNEADAYKPLTYTQFNALGLYRNDFRASAIEPSRRRRAAPETTHPRIRVHCLAGGEYELQTCPDAKLLDESLRCRPYDICTDRMTGFKHVYPTSADDRALTESEYYVCENNRSERRACNEGTVFSSALGNCVTRSVCYGRGDDTLPIDEHNYVQCTADTGRRVHCEYGISIASDGRRSCRLELCRPRVFTEETDALRYDFGEVRCDANGEPVETFCDSEPVDSPYKIEARWAVAESVEPYDRWPKEILRNGKCVAADDSIVLARSRVIELRWTSLMPRPHAYDLVTRRFVCSDDEYRVDYERNEVVPALPSGRYVQAATPCHSASALLTRWQLPWRNYDERVELPPNKPVAVVGVGYDFDALAACSERLWPVKRASDGAYCFVRVYPDRKSRDERVYDDIEYEYEYVYAVEECEDSKPPVGFDDPTDESLVTPNERNRLLVLRGFGQPSSLELATGKVWYTLATGRYDIVRSRKEIEQDGRFAVTDSNFRVVRRTEIPCPHYIRSPSVNAYREFGILWTRLDSRWQTLYDDELSCSRLGVRVKYNGDLPPGFYAIKTMGFHHYYEYRGTKIVMPTDLRIRYAEEEVLADD